MTVNEIINGIDITCETGEYYFSPNRVDSGTRFMLETVPVREGDKVLDLGCGYGVVGIYAAKKNAQTMSKKLQRKYGKRTKEI